jgi:SAM-dependent methyltransferase
MRTVLRRLADTSDPNSLSNRFRRGRFERFAELLASVPRPVWVLDVGGTASFWDHMRGLAGDDVNVVVLNLRAEDLEAADGVGTVAGDATDLSQYDDDAFDVVFSNSVIEHVGDLAAQRRMADEVRRTGRRYWVQTPNRWFPIEPHFLFPFFGVLPVPVRTWMIRHFDLGWRHKERDRVAARRVAESVRLLHRRELRARFPDAQVERERFLGFTKSWVMYGGWDRVDEPDEAPAAPVASRAQTRADASVASSDR